MSQLCDCTQELKLDTLTKNFYLIYETKNGKNKGELVECRLCLEDTIRNVPAYFANIDYKDPIIFSCPIDVDDIYSVARKSTIVCYSRLLNFPLQSRLRFRKEACCS